MGGMLLPRFAHTSIVRLPLAMLLLSAASIVTAENFTTAVSEARKTHFKFVPIEAHKLVMEDKPDEAMQCFIRAVPDAKLTAADCFVLGEIFFRYDIDRAVKYYRRASDLLPDEQETDLELGRSLHRQGYYSEAGLRYELFLEENPDRFLPHALLAECLIRAGKLKEAVEHWDKAYPEDNSTGIGRGIGEVHGPASPLKRRADLLKAVREGQTAKMEDIMALSAAWDTDWWSAEVNKAFLQRDVEMAKQVLAKEPQRLAELTLYARTYLEEANAEWLKKELEAGGWILGGRGKLPASSRVSERLISLVVKQRLTDPAFLLARFEEELRKRSFGEGSNDLGAAQLLAGLLIKAGKERSADATAVKRTGWLQYHDPVLAGGYLADKLNQNQLKLDSPELAQALKEFPQDGLLCMLRFILAKEEGKPLREPLAAAIQAEFNQLSVSVGTIKDTSRLNFFFKTLKERLEKGAD